MTASGAEQVRAICEQARERLRKAVESGEIERVAAVKAEAEALAAAVHPERGRLGKEAVLAAAELARRAERGIGVSIRRGQEEGTIRGQHDGKLMVQRGGTEPLRSPREFATAHELGGGKHSQAGIYDLTDGIPDDAFEAALREARAEGNLSRANVARRAAAHAAGAPAVTEWIPGPADHHGEDRAQRRRLIRKWAAEGYGSRQMAGLLGMSSEGVRRIARAEGIEIAADKVTANSLHLDSNRIVRETVHSLEGLVMGIELADVAALDPAEAREWAASLTASIRVLSRFTKKLKETTHGQA
jgi:hypothetical protein